MSNLFEAEAPQEKKPKKKRGKKKKHDKEAEPEADAGDVEEPLEENSAPSNQPVATPSRAPPPQPPAVKPSAEEPPLEAEAPQEKKYKKKNGKKKKNADAAADEPPAEQVEFVPPELAASPSQPPPPVKPTMEPKTPLKTPRKVPLQEPPKEPPPEMPLERPNEPPEKPTEPRQPPVVPPMKTPRKVVPPQPAVAKAHKKDAQTGHKKALARRKSTIDDVEQLPDECVEQSVAEDVYALRELDQVFFGAALARAHEFSHEGSREPLEPNKLLEQAINELRDNLQAVVRTGLFMRANRKAGEWDAEVDEMGDEDLFGGPGGDDIKKQLRALAHQEMRRRVELRLVFLKIGDIDTKEQLYEAEVFLQAKWHEPKLDELADKELAKYDLRDGWNPHLHLENLKRIENEERALFARRAETGETHVIERKKIMGTFTQLLQLEYFPFDVQDVSIMVVSEHDVDKVDLVPDEEEICNINTDGFNAANEWHLHPHVEVQRVLVESSLNAVAKDHPAVRVTTRVSRRFRFFFWNFALTLLLLAGLGFTNFGVEVVNDPYLRLFNEFLLLLSTIEFKFIITESLPEISYLTAMDFLVLVSLGSLFFMCIWHGALAVMPLSHESSKYIDNRVIAGYGAALLLALLVITLWIYFVAMRRRREMKQLDEDFADYMRCKFDWTLIERRRAREAAFLKRRYEEHSSRSTPRRAAGDGTPSEPPTSARSRAPAAPPN